MGALSKVWIATIVVAVGAAAVVLFIARGGDTSGVAATTPLRVTASLDRKAVEFGDPVAASVTVLADSRTVDPSAVRVHQDLAPLTQIGRTQITRTKRGRLLVITYRTRASCLDQRCLGNGRSKGIVLAPVRVDVAASGDQARTSWPALQVRSRVLPGDVVQENPPLRSDATPPPVNYRVAPDTLALALTIVAVLLAVAGVLVTGWAIAALIRRRRTEARRLTGLERALELAREAEARPPADRRRALGLLAGLLGGRNTRLADEAEELAWSAPAPQPAALSELVTQVEREVNGP
jgi:hypothetical protein